MRRPTLTTTIACLAAITAATGCSSQEPEPPAAAIASAAAQVGWSPCDALPADTVGGLVGERVSQETGTTDAPRCTFTPRTEGGAAYAINYLWFDGGLDAALDAAQETAGASAAQLRPITVAGAESARIAVRTQESGILVTGFVQTPGLVQSVNAAQPTPYDERRVVRGTKALLAELARRAPRASSG